MELSDQAFSFAGGAVPPFLGEKSVSTVETPREKPKGRSRRVTRSGAGSSIFLKSRDETVSDDSFCHISCFIFEYLAWSKKRSEKSRKPRSTDNICTGAFFSAPGLEGLLVIDPVHTPRSTSRFL